MKTQIYTDSKMMFC